MDASQTSDGVTRFFEINRTDESKDRNKILQISTYIESAISELLRISMITSDRETVSFGYSSQALSFSARLNLLLDFEIFDKKEKTFFIKFSELRNKFAHNYEIKCLHDLLNKENEQETLRYLERNFSSKIANYQRTETNSWLLVDFLVDEIEALLNKFHNKISDNILKLAKKKSDLLLLGYLRGMLENQDELAKIHPDAPDILKKILLTASIKLFNTTNTMSQEEFSDMIDEKLI